jgi:hypothetical protein
MSPSPYQEKPNHQIHGCRDTFGFRAELFRPVGLPGAVGVRRGRMNLCGTDRDMTKDDGPIRLGAVRWLSATELLRTGLKVVLAGVFGQYADKREMQHGPMFEQSHFDHRGDGDLWFDFVSDVGDGFNASYSVASLLASDLASPADGEVLPRGDLLIMGGDQGRRTSAAGARARSVRTSRSGYHAGGGCSPSTYSWTRISTSPARLLSRRGRRHR